MSYPTAIEGVLERLTTVTQLAYVQHGYPTAVHDTPMAYVAFDGFGRSQPGQIVANKYRVRIRLVVAWQDNEAAEDELAGLVNPLAAAFDTAGIDDNSHRYATLGGRVNSALLLNVTSGDSNGFHDIGGTTYRTATFELEVTDKAAGGSGI